MLEGDRTAAQQRVDHALMIEGDLYAPAEEADAEGQAPDPARQAWAEAQRVAVVAHAAQAVNRRDPCPCERAHVHAVADVVLQVVEVHQRRLGEVVVGQLQVADLGGNHRLRA